MARVSRYLFGRHRMAQAEAIESAAAASSGTPPPAATSDPALVSENVYNVTLPLNGEWFGPDAIPTGSAGASVHFIGEPSATTTNAAFCIEGSADGVNWRPLTGFNALTSAASPLSAASFALFKIPAYTRYVRPRVVTQPTGATTQHVGKVALRVMAVPV